MNNSFISIAAVVVTRNRKLLLSQCLRFIISQSMQVSKIFVVDNASTDGTSEMFDSSGEWKNGNIQYIKLKNNTGGAGGFSIGINAAIEAGYAWLWLMDDDTLPNCDALEELVKPLGSLGDRVGFVASHVVWQDQSVHKMNIPGIKLIIDGYPYNSQINNNVLIVPSCSFVSVLVSSAAVIKAGLPIRHMFIWGDDIEFFTRLRKIGFLGFYAWKSVATHKTALNINDDLFSARPSEFFKYYFGIRNNLILIRRHSGFLAYLKLFLRNIIIINFELINFKSSHRINLIILNTRATFSSLFFNPSIEYPGEDKL